ncbi:MAG: tRNA pseudouridine(55) synthase TruB [Rhodoluna sp.]
MSSGLVLIDKPSGWTSHDVVARLRKLAGTRRVGHAGTLDPMATGLLLIGVNSATKLLTFLVGENKTYVATIRLGAATITDDKESEFTSIAGAETVKALTSGQLETAISQLRGPIQQVPSSVSAIKVDGERAYAKVRSGDEVKLKARPVTIHRFEVIGEPRLVEDSGQQFLDFDAVIDCSSGTYIRALARDLGADLGVGGHLTSLRRTKIGSYLIEQAQSLDGLTAESLNILPIEEAATQQFKVRDLSEQDAIDLRHGKRLRVQEETETEPTAAIDGSGKLVAMLTKSGNAAKSLVVFAVGEEG